MKVYINKKGEGYVDSALSILMTLFVLVLSINIFSFVQTGLKLDYFAREMTYTAVSYGEIGEQTDSRYEKLCEITGIYPEISFETEYFDYENKTVQLGETIECHLSYQYSFAGFAGAIFNVNLIARHSGVSQVYQK